MSFENSRRMAEQALALYDSQIYWIADADYHEGHATLTYPAGHRLCGEYMGAVIIMARASGYTMYFSEDMVGKTLNVKMDHTIESTEELLETFAKSTP